MIVSQLENSVVLRFKCRKCLQEIDFPLEKAQLENGPFPLAIQNTHGEPKHQFIVKINSELELQSFEIKEGLQNLPETIKSDYSHKIFQASGLNDREIHIHSVSSGKGPLTIGEIALLSNNPTPYCQNVVQKLLKMGLFREINGARQYYQALAPYAAIISQLNQFGQFLFETKKETPLQLQNSFATIIDEISGLKNLEDFRGYISKLKAEIGNEIQSGTQALNESIQLVKRDDNLVAIQNLKAQTSDLLSIQFEALDKQIFSALNIFDSVFSVLSGKLESSVDIVVRMMENLNAGLDDLRHKVSNNVSKLKLGILQKAVEEVVGRTFASNMDEIKNTLKNNLMQGFQAFFDDLKNTFNDQLEQPIRQILNTSKNSFHSDFEQPFLSYIDNVYSSVDETSKKSTQIAFDLKSKFSLVTNNFNQMVAESERKIDNIYTTVESSFSQLRNDFSENVIKVLNSILVKMMYKLAVTSKSIEEIWDEAKTANELSMEDVWFIRTPEGMISHINEAITRSKMRVLIVAPSLSNIPIEPFFSLKKHINLRICCKIDVSDPLHRDKLDYLASLENCTVRNRDLGNLWSLSRDNEEIVLGIVNRQTEARSSEMEVVGIGSVLDEHISILVPIMEEAWMGATKKIPYNPTPRIPQIEKHELELYENEEIMIQNPDLNIDNSDIISNPQEDYSELNQSRKEIAENINSLISNLKSIKPKILSNLFNELIDNIIDRIGYFSNLADIKNWANVLSVLEDFDEKTLDELTSELTIWRNEIQ